MYFQMLYNKARVKKQNYIDTLGGTMKNLYLQFNSQHISTETLYTYPASTQQKFWDNQLKNYLIRKSKIQNNNNNDPTHNNLH